VVWLVENVEMVQVWVWCANTGFGGRLGDDATESDMKRLVFVLALTGSLATDARADDATTIAVNSGVPIAKLEGAGAQIYMCAKNAAGVLNWTFREPIATLLDEGKTVGRHFVGPTWEFADGSHVVGEQVSEAPGKTAKDIPWLKLSVKEPPKSGLVAGATTVLRIDTKRGAFEGACNNEGELHPEPYTATYIFVK
jgi:Protein of unknown function (DUF3455)